MTKKQFMDIDRFINEKSQNGTTTVETEDLNFHFGTPLDGDEFSIVPTSAAKGMNFLYQDLKILLLQLLWLVLALQIQDQLN